MGRIFLEHPGGTNVFSCFQCKTPLTNRAGILSTHFVASSGPAILFERVVNVLNGPVKTQQMITGEHEVCDVSCKVCKKKLGWTYLKAYPVEQRYKEGHFVLEKSMIKETKGVFPS